MTEFQPEVRVERELGDYRVFSYVIEGTVKVFIENMCGYNFLNDNIKEEFTKEVELFISSLGNAPDNFDDNDRQEIKSSVEKLLIDYFNSGKLV